MYIKYAESYLSQILDPTIFQAEHSCQSPFENGDDCDKIGKSRACDRGRQCRKAAAEESPGFTGQDAG
jgi:hypothetical protein